MIKSADFQKMKDDIGYIKKALAGNGEIGLIKETRKNTEFRLLFKGYAAAIVTIAAIISGLVAWIISYIRGK